MKKAGKIISIIVIALVVLILLVIAGFNIRQRINCSEFYKVTEKEMRVPGLSSGYTPQGFEILNDDTYISCGYMKDGSASRVYAFTKEGEEQYVTLLTKDGKADHIHAGGLAVWEDFLYVCAGDDVNVYNLDNFKTALKKNGEIKPIASFNAIAGPAFCYVQNDKLYVGEFYIAEDYETPQDHRMVTDSGDNHKSLMSVFPLSTEAEFGVESLIPEAIYSITDCAQGMCITESGKICISTSYGLSFSQIFVYENPIDNEADGNYSTEIDGEAVEIPLYYLDSAHLKETWIVPPMSEELIYENGKVMIMSESACKKYMFGKISGGIYIYSIPIK